MQLTYDAVRQAMERIRPPADPNLEGLVCQRMSMLTKPAGSLGRLEDLALRVALMRGEMSPAIRRKRMVVFCGDHGVTAEGVSAYPSDVTRQMAANFVRGGAAISVLCRQYNIECVVVDAGIEGDPVPGVVPGKIAPGTRNFAREPAMTREQAEASIALGFSQASDADLLGAGEMGIGNTTSAAALMAAFTGLDPAACAGRGTGVDDATLAHKVDVIRRALDLHRPDPANAIGTLAALGGFEIGAIAGFILGAAASRTPVVLDGFIACSAALVVRALCPTALDYVVYAHRSQEHGHAAMLTTLGADPLLDLGMRLGEGSGAALGMQVVESAVRLYVEMATFRDAGVSEASA
ncbi:MAG: nicotinate-nucleotide--dimethylbenzimidazole phosphoribosyltransferase [Bryobacteraceae bacterium]